MKNFESENAQSIEAGFVSTRNSCGDQNYRGIKGYCLLAVVGVVQSRSSSDCWTHLVCFVVSFTKAKEAMAIFLSTSLRSVRKQDDDFLGACLTTNFPASEITENVGSASIADHKCGRPAKPDQRFYFLTQLVGIMGGSGSSLITTYRCHMLLPLLRPIRFSCQCLGRDDSFLISVMAPGEKKGLTSLMAGSTTISAWRPYGRTEIHRSVSM